MYRYAFAVATAAVVLLLPAAHAAEKERPVVEILSPKSETKVAQHDELKGRITKGWPVVLVKPLVAGGQPWYIQLPVEKVTDKGLFAAEVFFGTDKTPSGTKFRIVVLAIPSKAEAEKRFKRGAVLKTLPVEYPASEPVTVLRE